MKKINILLFFSICYFFAPAQISFLSSDIATPGWVNAQHKDTLVSRVFPTNFGSKGANQVYDFSTFHNTVLDSTYYLTPTSGQLAIVPNANIAVTNDHTTYLLGKTTSSNFVFDGLQTVAFGNTIISNYTQLDTDFKFPTAYGQNFRGTYGGATKLKASSVNSNLTLLGWDSIKIVNSTNYTDTIDGWGVVKTPTGTYNCLRQKRIEVSTTTLYYNTSNGGAYTLMPTSILGTQVLASNPIVSTSKYYYYLAKETHGTVISFTYDSINEPISASWSTTPPYPIANFGYTTGSNGSAAFTDSSKGAPLTYSWNFGDGTANSTATNPSHNFSANGTYNVCLTVTNSSGTNTKCDSVHITNIIAGSPPVAQITPSGHDTICPGGSVVLKAQTGVGYTFKWSDASHSTTDSITVTTGGSYTVTVYHATDSAISASTTIVLASIPSASISLTGVATFCTGDSTILSAAAGLSYHWSTTATSQSIVVRTTGNYTVTVTNSNGCMASSVQHITVNIPAVDVITVSGLVLTSQPESSYQWYRGATLLPGASSQSYTATQNGVYNVKITDANGCSSTSNSITITGVGINEISSADVKLYPNPASDMIQIDLSHVDQAILKDLSNMIVYDLLGNKVKTISIDTMSISVKDLSNGVYLIGVVDKNQNRKILGKFEVLK